MKFEWKRLLPKYWFQQGPTDWDWDTILNEILDTADKVKVGNHTANIDGVDIWTSNWPYAYGNCYSYSSGLPSIKTRHRLRKLIEATRKRQFRETIEKLRNK